LIEIALGAGFAFNSLLMDTPISDSGAAGPDPTAGQDHFPATRWSLVLSTKSTDTSLAQRAVAELCRTYWYPLYSFVRRQGLNPQDAEDRTQEFFQSLIARNSLTSVEAERGKLRSFLLSGIKKSMVSNHRREAAAKRGGGAVVFSIDQAQAESRFGKEPSHDQSPDLIFEQNWAQAILDAASERLDRWYASADRLKLFEVIRPFLDGRDAPGAYHAAAAALNINESTLRASIFQMRKRYRGLIEEEIRQTVVTPEEAAAEMDYLRAVLAGR
jgi:DNA-directed RNA polymerase specialized sigma24 family protein